MISTLKTQSTNQLTNKTTNQPINQPTNQPYYMKNIILFFATIFLSINSFAQQHDISLKLKKGETYTQHLTSDMNMVQGINGQDMEVNMGMNAKMAFKVLNIVDHIFELEVSYQSLSMKMGMAGRDMVFDSEKKDTTDVMSKLLNAMKKNSFIIKMSKSGQVTEVKGIDRLFSSIDAMKELEQAQKEQMKSVLAKSYGEKAFKSNLEMSMAVYPSNPVKVGGTWEFSGKIESSINAAVETIYTLKEVNDDFYIITGNSKIKTLSKDEYTSTNGMEIKYDLTGTMQSEVKLNRKTGWIVGGNVDQQISGDTLIKASEQVPDGLTIPLKMKTKMIISEK